MITYSKTHTQLHFLAEESSMTGLAIRHYFSKEIFDTEVLAFNWKSPESVAFPNLLRDVSKNFKLKNPILDQQYELNSKSQGVLNGNWKTFLEVHLDNYHVELFHPGMNSAIAINEISWLPSEYGCLHRVPLKNFGLLDEPISDWKKYSTFLISTETNMEILWFTIYPNIIIEIYPGLLCLTTIHPINSRKYTFETQFYSERKHKILFNAALSAYTETFIEDLNLINKIEEGRTCMWTKGESDAGPYHPLLEFGVQHFHVFFRESMINTLTSHNK